MWLHILERPVLDSVQRAGRQVKRDDGVCIVLTARSKIATVAATSHQEESIAMEADAKSSILHSIVRKMGAGGADITTDEWLNFVEAQNDGFKTGPEIGDKVPAFTLSDQEGRMHKLNTLTGASGLLLVFSRSAGW
jgi:hypothetical protein